MTHFPLTDRNAASDPTVEKVFAEIEADLGFGMVPNLFKAMAKNPGFLAANWTYFRSVILEGSLPRTLKEMAGVVISQHNESPYARDVHLHGLSAFGTDDETLRALVDDFATSPLPENQKELIRIAFTTATRPSALTSEEIAAYEAKGITRDEIFEMITVGCLFSALNRFTDAIDLEVDSL